VSQKTSVPKKNTARNLTDTWLTSKSISRNALTDSQRVAKMKPIEQLKQECPELYRLILAIKYHKPRMTRKEKQKWMDMNSKVSYGK